MLVFTLTEIIPLAIHMSLRLVWAGRFGRELVKDTRTGPHRGPEDKKDPNRVISGV